MYTNSDYTDMLLILGESRNNAAGAARLYAERYNARRHPDQNVFRRLEQRLRETGNFVPIGINRGRERTVRNPQLEENVLLTIVEDPTKSTRGIAQELDVHHSLVWNILNDEKYHPFHYYKVHALLPADFNQRIKYCNWLLQEIEADRNFTCHE